MGGILIISLDDKEKQIKDKNIRAGLIAGKDLYRRWLCLSSDNKMTKEQQDVEIEIEHRCFS